MYLHFLARILNLSTVIRTLFLHVTLCAGLVLSGLVSADLTGVSSSVMTLKIFVLQLAGIVNYSLPERRSLADVPCAGYPERIF